MRKYRRNEVVKKDYKFCKLLSGRIVAVLTDLHGVEMSPWAIYAGQTFMWPPAMNDYNFHYEVEEACTVAESTDAAANEAMPDNFMARALDTMADMRTQDALSRYCKQLLLAARAEVPDITMEGVGVREVPIRVSRQGFARLVGVDRGSISKLTRFLVVNGVIRPREEGERFWFLIPVEPGGRLERLAISKYGYENEDRKRMFGTGSTRPLTAKQVATQEKKAEERKQRQRDRARANGAAGRARLAKEKLANG